MRIAVLLPFLFFPALATAQANGDGERGSTPPGLSQDGARPAEGAIKGGAIAPGESGGMPRKGPAAPRADTPGAGGTASALQRCYQLEGTLREQCVADRLNKEESGARAPTSGAAAGRE